MRKYEITKEQIIELYNCGNPQPLIRKLFPEEFKPVFEIGNWYKSHIGTLTYYSGEEKMCGVSTCGQWNDVIITKTAIKSCCAGVWVIADKSEVYDALKNESHKRYKEGDYLKNHHGTWELKELNIVYSDKYNNGIYNKQDSGKWLFLNGEWAEKIPTKAKAEAEKELNCKIID